ncbi:MAG: DUF308 domain-containing protein [archaeon]
MLRGVLFRVLGVVFILFGIALMFNSFQGLEGYVVFEGTDVVFGYFFGVVFILVGVVLLMVAKKFHKITSRIESDSTLMRLTKDAVTNQDVQRDINHLTNELYRGNMNPGIGTRKLFGNISYLRGRLGGRVFYRSKPGGYEILAKASKANEDSVIGRLVDIYSSKAKKKRAG